MSRITIAIDGPAGSGKSTTAREVAKRLGYVYVDSGAMYRAVTFKVLQNHLSPTDSEKVAEIAKEIDIQLLPSEKTKILIDGEDRSDDIRKPEITKNIGPIAANPNVRAELVRRQQKMGETGGVIMDGRDTTTVVFPNAELKIFMNASAEVRAERRLEEFARLGSSKHSLEEVLADIIARDKADETREVGPLKKADDAVVVDTSSMSIEAQTDFIYNLALQTIQSRRQ